MARDEARADRLARFLLKKVNKAIYEFNMIRNGDRIAVAPPPACPLGENTQRQRVKDLMAEMKKDCPKVARNLVRSALQAQNSSRIS